VKEDESYIFVTDLKSIACIRGIAKKGPAKNCKFTRNHVLVNFTNRLGVNQLICVAINKTVL
jgi:hypothetical protein